MISTKTNVNKKVKNTLLIRHFLEHFHFISQARKCRMSNVFFTFFIDICFSGNQAKYSATKAMVWTFYAQKIPTNLLQAMHNCISLRILCSVIFVCQPKRKDMRK